MHMEEILDDRLTSFDPGYMSDHDNIKALYWYLLSTTIRGSKHKTDVSWHKRNTKAMIALGFPIHPESCPDWD